LIFRSFPQENEKNKREPLISVKLISGSLNLSNPHDLNIYTNSLYNWYKRERIFYE